MCAEQILMVKQTTLNCQILIPHLILWLPLCGYPVLPNQPSSILHDCEDEEGAEEYLLSSGEESEEGEEEGEEEVEDNEFMEAEQRRFDAQLPMLILPLYSLLSAEQQARVIPFR